MQRIRLSVGSNQQVQELTKKNYKTQQLQGELQPANHQACGQARSAVRTSQPSPDRYGRGKTDLAQSWGLRQLTAKNLSGALRGFHADASDNESNGRLSVNSRKVKLRTFRLASKMGVRTGEGDASGAFVARASQTALQHNQDTDRDPGMNFGRGSVQSGTSLERPRPPGKKRKLKLAAYSQLRRRRQKSSHGHASKLVSSILGESTAGLQNTLPPQADVSAMGATSVYSPLKAAVHSTWA